MRTPGLDPTFLDPSEGYDAKEDSTSPPKIGQSRPGIYYRAPNLCTGGLPPGRSRRGWEDSRAAIGWFWNKGAGETETGSWNSLGRFSDGNIEIVFWIFGFFVTGGSVWTAYQESNYKFRPRLLPTPWIWGPLPNGKYASSSISGF